MEEYMLIFRHENAQNQVSPEQMQAWMKQTMNWIGSIAAQNKYSGGNGLPFDDARVVRATGADAIVTNGPFGDIKETIGGYIIVKGESVDEAVEFAKGCPILMGEGNSVEVRRIARGEVS
ncbi:YciI family protein [Telluribacter humicola]|uniref:YciI family protein n=1 Tax=Telluribacter humicola TaxID=1720261 RepID=UPI001A95ABAE|nr:YciI family protein [Telluribacter humicola]